jgi:hypothetical protein
MKIDGRWIYGSFVVLSSLFVATGIAFHIHRDYERRREANRPADVIEAELLAATPLGSSIAAVQRYVERRWSCTADVVREPAEGGQSRRVIVQEYGSYGTRYSCYFFCTSVTSVGVSWYFNDHGKLEAVRVEKTNMSI